jgi:hypothetical protein
MLPPSEALLLGQPENKEHLDKFKTNKCSVIELKRLLTIGHHPQPVLPTSYPNCYPSISSSVFQVTIFTQFFHHSRYMHSPLWPDRFYYPNKSKDLVLKPMYRKFNSATFTPLINAQVYGWLLEFVFIIIQSLYWYSIPHYNKKISKTMVCGICGGQSGAGAGFLRVLRFLLPIFIPSISPQSPSSIIWGLYNRPAVAAVPSGLSLTPLTIIIIMVERLTRTVDI